MESDRKPNKCPACGMALVHWFDERGSFSECTSCQYHRVNATYALPLYSGDESSSGDWWEDWDDDDTRYNNCEDCYGEFIVQYRNQRGAIVRTEETRYCEDCAALHAKYYQQYVEEMRRSPRHGFVYLLDSRVGVWKIGRSSTPVQRVETLEVKLPYVFEVVALIETRDMYHVESRLHKKYAAKRLKGEWFRLDSEDIEYIKSLVGVPAWQRRIEQMIAEEDALWR